MKWVPDRTGRFPERPHYEPHELDYECEGIVSAFLRRHYSSISYPIDTNDLVILVEQEAASLDLYADLSDEGDEVEGVTDFFPPGKPEVRIDHRLSEQTWRENRLRTTLTHELGHVKFHHFLWAAKAQQMPLFKGSAPGDSAQCKRESIIGASTVDWMEWQAGYISGALLMPISPLRKIVAGFMTDAGLLGNLYADHPSAQELMSRVQGAFQVSQDAARVRLIKLGHLSDQAAPQGVFGS